MDELIQNIIQLKLKYPNQKKVVIKLNEGVSGGGNAILCLPDTDFATTAETERVEIVRNNLEHLEFMVTCENWESFSEKILHTGAIVELWIEAKDLTSPSAQGIIKEDGTVQILSTHEQILERSNTYLGCSFPANVNYSKQIEHYSFLAGEVLSKKGARGRFALDFVTAPKATDGSQYDVFAIEINLRMTGTTHPFEITNLLLNNLETPLPESVGLQYNGVCSLSFSAFFPVRLLILLFSPFRSTNTTVLRVCIMININLFLSVNLLQFWRILSLIGMKRPRLVVYFITLVL